MLMTEVCTWTSRTSGKMPVICIGTHTLLMPQVEAVACRVAGVTQPHTTLVAKPVGVSMTATATPPPLLVLHGPDSLGGVMGKCWRTTAPPRQPATVVPKL